MASLKTAGIASGLGQAGAKMSAGLLAGQQREEAKEALGQDQATKEAQILLGAYDKVGDPDAFTDMWNTFIQKRGLPWPEMQFNQRTNEGDTFTTRDGRIWLKRPGEPAPIDITPDDQRARIEAEEAQASGLRDREVAVAEAGVDVRQQEVDNRKKALEIAAQEATQTGQISGSTLEYLAGMVQEYHARQADPDDTMTTEEQELFEKMKTFLDNYLASQAQAAPTGPGLSGGVQQPAGPAAVQAPTRRTYDPASGMLSGGPASRTVTGGPSTRQTFRVGPDGRPIQ